MGGIQRDRGDDDQERRALLAAMLGVYASAVLPNDQARSRAVGLRTMSVPDAVATIAAARGPLRDRARRVVAARLAVGAFVDARRDLELALVDLLGPALVTKIRTVVDGKRVAPSVMAAVYQVLGGRSGSAIEAPEPNTRCALDIRTMATTVDVTTAYEGTFEELAVKLDPRSWITSPFWLAATKVIRVDGRFVPDPNPPPLGTSWRGYFYESVEWSTDACTYSCFQNYLNVDFRVEAPNAIDLQFSLYASRGSMILARIAEGGTEIDSGFSRARPFLGNAGRRAFAVSAQKCIRFSDTVSRDTPNQGPDGAGQGLNCMTPAVVSVWMNDLLYENLNRGADHDERS